VVSWRGKHIDLTATEFQTADRTRSAPGRVQSRDQLLRDVWEYNSLVDTRTVDTHMRRLREKLGRPRNISIPSVVSATGLWKARG